MLAANCTPSSVRFPPRPEFPVDGTTGCSPRLPTPPGVSYSRASRGSNGPTGREGPAPGHLGGGSPGKPFPGERALPRLPDESCVLNPTGCSFLPGAAARPSTVPSPRDGHLRERAARAPHPAATCAAQLALSGQPAEWVTAPPPHQGPHGALPSGATGGAERGEMFPAGAERRPAEAGPSPPAPVGEHLLPCALVGAQPAGPRRQPRSSPSPDPKPLSRGDATFLSPNVRGSGRGPLPREASLPASLELLPRNLWQL